MFKSLSLFAVALTAISPRSRRRRRKRSPPKSGAAPTLRFRAATAPPRTLAPTICGLKTAFSINLRAQNVSALRPDRRPKTSGRSRKSHATPDTWARPTALRPTIKNGFFACLGRARWRRGRGVGRKNAQLGQRAAQCSHVGHRPATRSRRTLGTFSILGTGKLGDVVTFSSPELATWLQGDTDKMATLIITRDLAEVGTADNVSHVLFCPKNNRKQPIADVGFEFQVSVFTRCGKLRTFFPHPNPLPEGEGTTPA